MEKTPGDIIILHKYTKNYDHMLYCSWDVVRDRCNCYFSFLLYLPFYHLPPPPPLTPPKKWKFQKNSQQNSPKQPKKWKLQENEKRKKKHLEISFYTSVPKNMIICCTVPEIRCMTDVIIFHFGLFFAL